MMCHPCLDYAVQGVPMPPRWVAGWHRGHGSGCPDLGSRELARCFADLPDHHGHEHHCDGDEGPVAPDGLLDRGPASEQHGHPAAPGEEVLRVIQAAAPLVEGSHLGGDAAEDGCGLAGE